MTLQKHVEKHKAKIIWEEIQVTQLRLCLATLKIEKVIAETDWKLLEAPWCTVHPRVFLYPLVILDIFFSSHVMKKCEKVYSAPGCIQYAHETDEVLQLDELNGLIRWIIL